MKKRYFIISLLIICIIVLIIFLYNKKVTVKAEKENNNIINQTNKNNEPKENEPYKEKEIIENDKTDKKEEIELKYDQYVIANGFMGASDNAYYTRNNTLYHLIISTNETIKLAEGVEKIEDDRDTLLVYKDKNFKIINVD